MESIWGIRTGIGRAFHIFRKREQRRDPDTRQAFEIELQNRFESLFVEEEEEEVSIINEIGGTDEDITARTRKAQSTFSMLLPVWKEKCIRLQTKLRIFDTNVKSVLLYGSETWRSTKLLIKKLQTFINKCLRRILISVDQRSSQMKNYGE